MNDLKEVTTIDLVNEYKKRREQILEIRLKELNELIKEMEELEMPICNSGDLDFKLGNFEVIKDHGKKILTYEEIHCH